MAVRFRTGCGAPAVGFPDEEAAASDEDSVVTANHRELTEPVELEHPDHPGEAILSLVAADWSSRADEAHHLEVGVERGQCIEIDRLERAQDEALGLELHAMRQSARARQS